MKRLFFLLIASNLLVHYAHAQNTDPWPNTGPVGIGTNSPASGLMLDVRGAGSFSDCLNLGTLGGGTNVFYKLLSGSYSGIPYVSYPGQFRWYASPNNSLYKDNALFQLRSWDAGTNIENTMATFNGSGNLALGFDMSSPSAARLHIVGAAGLRPIYLTGETTEGEFLAASKTNGGYATHFYTSGGNNGTDQALRVGNASGNTLFTTLYNGNFGIGTQTPGSILSVMGGNTGISIHPLGNPYFGTIAFNREAATGAIFDPAGNAFQINNGGTDKNLHFQVYNGNGGGVSADALVISGTNANVGIGTASPSSALDVGGAIQISSISQNTPPAGLSYGLFPYGGVGLGIFSGAVDAVHQGIGFWTNPGGTATEVMRIAAGGDVGIGTTAPAGRLEIKSNAIWDASTILRITNNADNYGRANLIITGRIQDGNDGWNFGTGARNSIVFAENAATSGTSVGATGDEKFSIQLEGNSSNLGFLSKQNGSSPSMVLTQGGFVGIGTTQPDTKLAVKGTVHANEVKVDLNVPGPDYVFKAGYALPGLDDLRSYLQTHHHLPEIPSADEMTRTGIALGEFDMKLLKKVEELTLYLLEKEAEVKQLKTAGQAQEDRLKKLEVLVAQLSKTKP